MTIRMFLIRAVQVFALAMIGTSFIADTSHARQSKQDLQYFCSGIGGEFVDDERTGKYSCIWSPHDGGSTNVTSCRPDGTCFLSECGRGGCVHYYEKDYSGKKVKPPKPSRRDGIATAGTTDDRGLGGKRGTISGTVLSGAVSEGSVGAPKSAPSQTNTKAAPSSTAKPLLWGGSASSTAKSALSSTAKPPLLGGSAFGTRAGQAH